MDIELCRPLRGLKVNIWSDFLVKTGLVAEADAEQTVLIWDAGQLIATGSRTGNLLKYISVDPLRQGEGLLAKVLTALRQEAFREGHLHRLPAQAGVLGQGHRILLCAGSAGSPAKPYGGGAGHRPRDPRERGVLPDPV